MNVSNDKAEKEMKQASKPVDENAGIKMSGHILIRDADTKEEFVNKGITTELGQAGRLLSGVSQFMTKKSTPHFRQILHFEGGGGTSGQRKNHYIVLEQYRNLLQEVLNEVLQKDK